MPLGRKELNRIYEDKIYFEAETVNPKQGKIKWSGIFHGDSIAVIYRWSKKSWLSEIEKNYRLGPMTSSNSMVARSSQAKISQHNSRRYYQ